MDEDVGLSTETRRLRMIQSRDAQFRRRKERFLLSNQDYSQEYLAMLQEKKSRASVPTPEDNYSPPPIPERRNSGVPLTTPESASLASSPSYSLATAPSTRESAEALHMRLIGLSNKLDSGKTQGPNPVLPLPTGPGIRMIASLNGGSTALDLSDHELFTTSPVPKGAMVQCYITRIKGGLKNMFSTSYECYLQVDDTFLIGAKRGTSAGYTLSLEKKKYDKSGKSYLGKLKSNFVGTEFTLYDSGLNPGRLEAKELESFQSSLRKEMSVVTYEANVLSSKGPRKMTALVPLVRNDGSVAVWRPSKTADGILTNYRATCTDQMQVLVNKPPRWNDAVGAYVLNFNGRVTMASVKNFQLVHENSDQVVLQFGKIGKDQFTMDFTWPLSPHQAFAMCISALDNKLACE